MASPMSLPYFAKRAKTLLSSFTAGFEPAIERARAVLTTVDDFGLMKAQHVVAVESGFTRWNELIKADDIELRLVITMDKHYYLNTFGIGLFDHGRGLTIAQCQEQSNQLRSELRRSVADVRWTVEWLRANVAPIKTINRRRTSYSLKHIAEKFHPNLYLTNGMFIAAALILDYPYHLTDGPNVEFGMSERSISQIRDRHGLERPVIIPIYDPGKLEPVLQD